VPKTPFFLHGVFLYRDCNDPESWFIPPSTVIDPFVFFRDINCDDPDMIPAYCDDCVVCDCFDKTYDKNRRARLIILILFNDLSLRDDCDQVIGRDVAFKHPYPGVM